jgi:hypothetical protein
VIYHDQQIAPHALFVHWGTRSHPITPREKKVLRYTSGSGAGTKFVFSRFVQHPGYKGDPWLVDGVNKAVALFDSIISELEG